MLHNKNLPPASWQSLRARCFGFQKQNRRTGYGGPFGSSVSFLTLRSQGTAPYSTNTGRPWASKGGSGRPWCWLFLEPASPVVPLVCLMSRFTLSCADSSPSLSQFPAYLLLSVTFSFLVGVQETVHLQAGCYCYSTYLSFLPRN